MMNDARAKTQLPHEKEKGMDQLIFFLFVGESRVKMQINQQKKG
jgi:hypothetical protein